MKYLSDRKTQALVDSAYDSCMTARAMAAEVKANPVHDREYHQKASTVVAAMNAAARQHQLVLATEQLAYRFDTIDVKRVESGDNDGNQKKLESGKRKAGRRRKRS